MELKKTKVTDQNRTQFYQQVYQQQLDSKLQLLPIGRADIKHVVAVDCCGWHYQTEFEDKNILPIETVSSAIEYQLPRNKFYKLLDNRHTPLKWPALDIDPDAVIFDRSPILKYQTLSSIESMLADVQNKYQPQYLLVRMNLMFVDTARLTDRFRDVSAIRVPNTVMLEFNYNANQDSCFFMCKKLTYYDCAH